MITIVVFEDVLVVEASSSLGFGHCVFVDRFSLFSLAAIQRGMSFVEENLELCDTIQYIFAKDCGVE